MSILEPESGIWYAICWLVVGTRLYSRRLHLGSWKRIQVDDYLILVAMATITLLMSFMHVVIHTDSNLLPPGFNVADLTPEEIKERIYGSKLVLVVEQMQIATIWLIKSCLLIMYSRLTALLPQHKIVKIVAVYVAVGFVVMEILYFGVWCRPFPEYYAVPTSSPQCSAAIHHLITNAVLNISSDVMIILIPMPLLFKVKLPSKNKAILIGIFLIGTFTIIAAALNKYYSFSHPFAVDWTIWYLRESYTAILCANLPLTWPVLQRIFNLSNWSHNSYGTGQYAAASHSRGGTSAFKSQAHKSRSFQATNHGRTGISRSDSQEAINRRGEPLEIIYNTEVTIHTTTLKELNQVSAMEMGEMTPQPRSSTDTKNSSSSSSDNQGVTTTCHHV